MRIVCFVGSPIVEDDKDLVKLAKRLKKEKVRFAPSVEPPSVDEEVVYELNQHIDDDISLIRLFRSGQRRRC